MRNPDPTSNQKANSMSITLDTPRGGDRITSGRAHKIGDSITVAEAT